MRNRRKEAPTTAGIVFVGNDDPQIDPGVDAHAHTVKRILQEMAPELRVEIATSNSDDALSTIEAFAAGEFDVLIAKQMAGRGLDIERLKVELDLSYVRTRPAFIQRLMRIATRWDRPGRSTVLTCTYIGPDDRLSLDLYDVLVTDQGGGVEQTMIGEWTEIDGDLDWTGGSTERELVLKDFEATGTGPGAALRDSDEVEAPGEVIGPVDSLFERHPELTPILGKAELGRAIDAVASSYSQNADNATPTQTAAQSQPPDGDAPNGRTRDLRADNRALRQTLNDLVRRMSVRQLERSHGADWPRERLQAEIRDTWLHLKTIARVSLDTELRNVPDDKLHEMIRLAREELADD